VLGFIILGVLVLLAMSGVFIVDQQEVALIERLGKFKRSVEAGLSWRVPFIDSVVDTMSLRQEQREFIVETKTHDNVFVKLHVALQYKIENAFSAFYKLDDLETQLETYTTNTVRSYVPSKTIDILFEEQDELSAQVKTTLSAVFAEFGVSIQAVLTGNIEVDEQVAAAMNQINAEQRLREAAIAKAEANKITRVKEAEAEAEAKELQGKGIAAQRKAIADGLAASAAAIGGENPLAYVVLTQYLDTLADMAKTSGSKVIFMPSGPGGLEDLKTQIIAASEAK
jgi:regulator of protease activity HflC (stomatin/prohibitin superfamily)